MLGQPVYFLTPDVVGFEPVSDTHLDVYKRQLQDRLGALMHGVDDWTTLQVPKSVAAAGLWAQAKLEPVIPDIIDKGVAPFVRPFMAEMADDHYALNTRRARDLLGWEPQHSFKDELPRLVQSLKDDPPGWYRRNGVTPVSYTHLDVYKRQTVHFVRIAKITPSSISLVTVRGSTSSRTATSARVITALPDVRRASTVISEDSGSSIFDMTSPIYFQILYF